VYQLKPGESPEDAAQALLGDRRLTTELDVSYGVAYVKGERHGPPAQWAARPPAIRKGDGLQKLE
jgi:hypothetical protein